MSVSSLPITTAPRKRGRQPSKCKTCKGCRLKKSCEKKNETPRQSKIQRTSTGGSLRSMESIQAAPALRTPKYPSNHIRDRRPSASNARPAAHNERAGNRVTYNTKANEKYNAEIERQRLLMLERQQQEQEKEEQRQQRLNTLRSTVQEDSDDDDDEDNDTEMNPIDPFEQLLVVAKFLNVDQATINILDSYGVVGSKSSSAGALQGKKTGRELGSFLTELLKAILGKIKFDGESDVGGLFQLMCRCSTFRNEILGQSSTENEALEKMKTF